VRNQESKDRSDYCNLHLESTLVLAGSWTVGQYGEDRADCNPLEYWRCSRPDCDRCYDHKLFGYFNLDRQPGSRIRRNPQTQERCYRHEELPNDPFLVVGKFGSGRRFRCPICDCDTVGSVAAEFVADMDEAGEQQQAPVLELTGDAKKEAFELSAFNEFARAAGLPVEEESARNAKPPQPDIRCRIDGEERWFELGRITDTHLTKTISIPSPKDPAPFSFAQKEPLLRIIEKKAAAHYEANGHPVDLVLYFEQQPPDRTALERHLRESAESLNELRQRGLFSRIWIYDRWSKSVLWQST
jgi:hypothetical protein